MQALKYSQLQRRLIQNVIHFNYYNTYITLGNEDIVRSRNMFVEFQKFLRLLVKELCSVILHPSFKIS